MIWFLIASTSALLSALATVGEKKTLFRMDAFEFSFLLSLAVVAVSSFTPFTTDLAAVPLSTALIILAKSFVSASAFLFVMLALREGEISNTLPLLGLTPAVTALMAFPVLGETLAPAEWGGVALMTAGTFLLEWRSGRPVAEVFKNLFRTTSRRYIGIAVILYAASSIVDRLLVGGYRVNPWIVLYYQHVVYCFFFGAILAYRHSFSPGALTEKAKASIILLLVTAMLTVAYRFAQLEAMKIAPAALVLAVKRTSVLYASLIGGTYFAEQRLGKRLLAAALIVAAGFLILRNGG